MKRTKGFALSAVLSVALAIGIPGCTGQREAPSPAGKTRAAAERKPVEGKLRVALLTPGPVSDAGWSAMAYEGLVAIRDELGAEINHQEARDARIPEAMRAYAREGYHLVIGHGYEYNAPAAEIGPSFPNTVFLSSSGNLTRENVGTFRFYLEQGFYLAGVMAGLMSRSGTVAMIGGDDVPSIRSTFKGFEAGVKSVRPDAQVIQIFTGSGQDVARARQATLQAIDQGADFVVHQANAAAKGVFDACRDRGVFAFGANLDQNGDPSGVVLASAVIRARPAFVEQAKRVRDGTFRGEVTLQGMEDGSVDFVINPALADRIPAEVRRRVEETKAKILSGEIVVPKDEF